MIETGKVKSFHDSAHRILIGLVVVAYIASLIAAVGYCAELILVSLAFPLANVPLSAHDALKTSYLLCASCGACCATLSGFFDLPISILTGENIRSIIRKMVSLGLFIFVALFGRYCFNNNIDSNLLIIPIILSIMAGTISSDDKATETPAKPDNLNDVLQYMTDDYEI